MTDLLDNKIKDILIVTPDHLDFDVVSSMHILAEILQQREKQVSILTNLESYNEQFKDEYEVKNLNIIGNIESKNFEAKVPQDREVENIDVEKDGSNFRIVINTKSGSLVEETLNFKRKKVKYDLIVLLGFTQFNNSEVFQKYFKKSLIANNTLLFNYYNSNVKTDFEYIVPASCLSESVKIFSQKNNYELNRRQATDLLAGLLFATKNLKMNTSRQTTRNVYLLVNKDKALIKTANNRVNRRLSKASILWLKLVLNNFQIYKNFCYSYVEHPQLESKMIGLLNKEDRVPMYRIGSCNVSMVLFKLGDTTHGFLQTNSKNYSALKLTSDFNVLGDKHHVHFWASMSPEKALDVVADKLHIQKQLELFRHETGRKEDLGSQILQSTLTIPDSKIRTKVSKRTKSIEKKEGGRGGIEKIVERKRKLATGEVKREVNAINPDDPGKDLEKTVMDDEEVSMGDEDIVQDEKEETESEPDNEATEQVFEKREKPDREESEQNESESQENDGEEVSAFFNANVSANDVLKNRKKNQSGDDLLQKSIQPTPVVQVKNNVSGDLRNAYAAQQINRSRNISPDVIKKQMMMQRMKQMRRNKKKGGPGFVPSNYDPLPPAKH